MKKVLIGLVAAVVLIVGGLFVWKQMTYGGPSYYTQITVDGKETTEKDDSGETFHRYEYKQAAYDDKGTEKSLDFTANHNLRKKAYLKLTYNSSKGVTNWEEVKKSELPKKTLEAMTKTTK